MQQKMLVNVQEDETRIALTEANRLVDLHVEQVSRERTMGNIYKGVIVNVNPAFQAAFVEYGEKKNGFLSINDINPNLFEQAGEKRSRSKIQSVLRSGQQVMVQVLKERVGDKGATLTTFISLPGRFMVLTPNSDRSGVSRKIEDSDKRGPLKDLLAGLVGDEKIGVIIRTAGIDRTAAELKRDLADLKRTWKSIESKNLKSRNPGLLYQEASSIVRVLRDYFSELVEEVWVDSAEIFSEALAYFKAVLPKYQKRLKLYVGDQSLFSSHRIEQQIEALDTAKVPLKSGGSIIIESTEALVSVDVNSGKSNRAEDIETTALHTNLEAAEEACRQLRLRNLGGLIVLDFIDMTPKKNRERVTKAVSDALKNDKARTTVGEISQFGLLELSRQRIDVELSRGSRMQCQSCSGTGFVPTVNSSANNVLRKIRELAATGRYGEINGELPLEHANFLLNLRRENLRDLELEFDIRIHLFGDPSLPAGHPTRLTGSVPTGTEEAGQEGIVVAETRKEPPHLDEADGDGRSKRRRRKRGRKSEQEEAGIAAAGEESAAGERQEEQRPAGRKTESLSPPAKAEKKRSPGRGAAGRAAPKTETAPAPAARSKEESSPKGLVYQKRGAWIADMGSNAAAGDTLFKSSHGAPPEDSPPVVGLTFKRSSAFKGAEAEDSSTVFDSSRLFGNKGQAGQEKEEADKSAKTPAKSPRSAAAKEAKTKKTATAAGKKPAGTRAKAAAKPKTAAKTGRGGAGKKAAPATAAKGAESGTGAAPAKRRKPAKAAAPGGEDKSAAETAPAKKSGRKPAGRTPRAKPAAKEAGTASG